MHRSAARPLISILGDSISTFEGCNPPGFDVFYEGARRRETGVERREDTWWGIVAEAVGGEVLVNGSFSGSMVEGAGFPAASSAERIAALARDGSAPDIVMAFIGINDYGWGGASNQAAARGRAVPACAQSCDARPVSYAAEDALPRFEAAYGVMLARIAAAYPQADVWCFTLCPGRVAHAGAPTFARRLRGVSFEGYNRAIARQAATHGCRLVDLAACGRDYETLDGTHPTARGMRQIAAMALRRLEPSCAEGGAALRAGLFAEAFGPGSLISAGPCEKPCCIGCPDARSTGATWSLVCERGLAWRA